MTPIPLALSVDVEDWPQSSWDRSLPLSDYCADNTRRLLDLLGDYRAARATFFVLGKFAERHPAVVRAIAEAGHEIGSHGHSHVEIFRLGRERFAEDLHRSTDVIAQTAAVRPVGYRAPDFSIVGESLWALDLLAENGYRYDSSIFPIAKRRYGIADWPRGPVLVRLSSGGTILELPPATLLWHGRRLAVGGGGYARLIPGMMLHWALRQAYAQLGAPLVYYCHPYEIDPDEFRRLNLSIPLKVRLHQGLGRRATAKKLRRLLRQFECLSLGAALDRITDPPVIDPAPYVLDPATVTRPPIFEGREPAPPSP